MQQRLRGKMLTQSLPQQLPTAITAVTVGATLAKKSISCIYFHEFFLNVTPKIIGMFNLCRIIQASQVLYLN